MEAMTIASTGQPAPPSMAQAAAEMAMAASNR
jgi:hypothetical protein